MGLSNAFLSRAYLMAQSIDADAIPRACPATPILPPSSVFIAILNPSPWLPSRLLQGIRTLSKITLAVDVARIPSLSSFAPRLNPSALVGMINAEIPLCLRLLSVVANTTAASASYALVIQALVPLIIQSSPSFVAVVEAAPASDPFPGSLRQKHPILLILLLSSSSIEGKAYGVINSSCCAGVPNSWIGYRYKELWADIMTPTEAQPRLISSIPTAYDNASNPLPPLSSGVLIPIKPSSDRAATAFVGNSCF
mmetsp:Transcript_54463/g.60877  ORF Transcript_54463/g.60877 Transcript_54463/m.60877 type:complete len:253 (+) Transcript_54463:1265-2023(+)